MDDDQLTGRMLARYRIEGKLGQGGMGAVFRAWDTNLRRWVAIKLLKAGADQNAERRTRFLMEARSAAALNHPNIVTIYEIGQSDAMDFIAMEFVPGRTLNQIIHSGQVLSLDEVLNYASQIADAVAAAHAAGITHRDLKPANIMVTSSGRLKVLDFGIAKRFEGGEDAEDTRTMAVQTLGGLAVGTPHYMSPEQAQGKLLDGRSDIFAIGAIIYEMLTGHRAFGGDSMAATLAAILTQDPPPVSTFRPVPEELGALVMRCLRKDLERRFQHAGDVKIVLDEIRAEHGTSPTHSSTGTVPTGQKVIRVLTVDDHALLRKGIRALIGAESDMQLVAEASTGREAVDVFRTHQPDVTLMDLQMPDMNGIEAIIAIRGEFPEARIVVLSTYSGDVQVVRALKAGARAYLLKGSVNKELLATIRAVHAGQKRIPAELASGLAEHTGEDQLSEREMEVLRLIAAGNANKEIAAQLGLAEDTVKRHVTNILSKLGANDRTHAVTIGLNRGIIELQ